MSHGHDFLAGDLHPPTAEELATRARAHAAAVLRDYHAQPRIGPSEHCRAAPLTGRRVPHRQRRERTAGDPGQRQVPALLGDCEPAPERRHHPQRTGPHKRPSRPSLTRAQVLEVHGSKAVVQVFEGTSGIDAKHTVCEFSGACAALHRATDAPQAIFSRRPCRRTCWGASSTAPARRSTTDRPCWPRTSWIFKARAARAFLFLSARRTAHQPVLTHLSRGDDPDRHLGHRHHEQHCSRPEDPHLLRRRPAPQRRLRELPTLTHAQHAPQIAAQICRQAGLVKHKGKAVYDNHEDNFAIVFAAMGVRHARACACADAAQVNMETARFFQQDFQENGSMERCVPRPVRRPSRCAV